MHEVKEREPFTGVMITHDLRESIYLADQVVVMSGRPAKTQYVLDLPVTGARSLETLYTPEASEMLKLLRREIEVAQGRAPKTPARADATEPTSTSANDNGGSAQ